MIFNILHSANINQRGFTAKPYLHDYDRFDEGGNNAQRRLFVGCLIVSGVQNVGFPWNG